MQARPAAPEDAAAIARIYNRGIEERIATFETRPRTAGEIRSWFGGRHPVVFVENGPSSAGCSGRWASARSASTRGTPVSTARGKTW